MPSASVNLTVRINQETSHRAPVPVGGGWCRGLVPSLALLPAGRVASVPQFPACHVEAVL